MNSLRPARSAYGGRFRNWPSTSRPFPSTCSPASTAVPHSSKSIRPESFLSSSTVTWCSSESIAIVLYLAEKYRDKGLIPTDLQQRAQLMRWLLFTTTEHEQPLWRIARHTTLYP